MTHSDWGQAVTRRKQLTLSHQIKCSARPGIFWVLMKAGCEIKGGSGREPGCLRSSTKSHFYPCLVLTVCSRILWISPAKQIFCIWFIWNYPKSLGWNVKRAHRKMLILLCSRIALMQDLISFFHPNFIWFYMVVNPGGLFQSFVYCRINLICCWLLFWLASSRPVQNKFSSSSIQTSVCTFTTPGNICQPLYEPVTAERDG